MRKLFGDIAWRFGHQPQTIDDFRILLHLDADVRHLQKAKSALLIIKCIDPRTYRLIPKLLPGGIAITKASSVAACFDPTRKACCLGWDYVERAQIEDIALTIVHELCHARLMHAGIGYDEPIRFRVEKVCIRRELAFARRLARHDPKHQHYTETRARHLETLTPGFYSDEEFKWRARQDILQTLRRLKALGTPAFLRRWAVFRVRRRWRQQRHQPV